MNYMMQCSEIWMYTAPTQPALNVDIKMGVKLNTDRIWQLNYCISVSDVPIQHLEVLL